jgi:hypothetical protein
MRRKRDRIDVGFDADPCSCDLDTFAHPAEHCQPHLNA